MGAHAPVAGPGRLELWHTRLAALAADGSLDESEAAGRPVRSIWTSDWNADSMFRSPVVLAARPGAAIAQRRPAPVDRAGLDDFGLAVTTGRLDDFGLAVTTGLYGAATAVARRLTLTVLGGWLDG